MLRAAAGSTAALYAFLVLAAAPAEAHGGSTGAQEFLQHNLVTGLFLLAIVAGVSALVWLNRPGSRAAPPAAETPGDRHDEA